MLFFVVRISHYCEFQVEHAFLNQSISRPPFNHHHVLEGVYLSCANTSYFIPVSVAVRRRFNASSKKKIILRKCPYIFSLRVS